MQSSSHSTYTSLEANAIDTDSTSTVTNALYINGNRSLGLFVSADTGAHTSHVITLQVSADGIAWFDGPLSVTGVGFVQGETVSANIRAKVTTAEGGTSTCNITIVSK